MVQIKEQLIHDTSFKYGKNNKKRYITIHETDNVNHGAGAQNHANLQTNGNSREAAWHWQVDDKMAIKSFDHRFQLWGAGDGRGNGNLHSIQIEICVNADSDYKKAIENTADLVKDIMRDEGISSSQVNQHNRWSGKHCPRKLRDGMHGVTWSQFKKMIGKASSNHSISKPAKKNNSSNWTKVTGNWTGQTLGNGEYGEPVKQLQTKLANHNPPFYPNKGAENHGIDSYYGKDTENAVTRFQSYYGLTTDGLAGKQVYHQLINPSTSISSSDSEKSISQLVKETKAGKHGNGEARKKSLGSNYQAVMDVINGEISSINSKSNTIREGSKVSANRLYTTSSSTENVRLSSISGIVDTVNDSWRNEIRLKDENGQYIGFARRQDLQ
ncbi:N-acetylmuramoyl-L-alanine amidase [Oceanobacillus jeddahense]|uniref:N-acetylmuramoyl-L-alanine amidase n=1 Tax=Oceanobacillus jeddahense TaxID=1462527 RepID=UPI000694CE65|nr:N-acetylmuramoyl-L-alanine amidase [Oceanobacillus jeddahense]